MLTQRVSGQTGAVFIPSNYRGNALYFENPEKEDEPCAEGGGEKTQPTQPREDACRAGERGGLGSLAARLADSEGLLLLAVTALLLFSGGDKKQMDGCRDEGGADLVLVLVLALLLLS